MDTTDPDPDLVPVPTIESLCDEDGIVEDIVYYPIFVEYDEGHTDLATFVKLHRRLRLLRGYTKRLPASFVTTLVVNEMLLDTNDAEHLTPTLTQQEK